MMDLDEVFSIPISLLATTTLAAVVILALVVLIHGRKRSSYHPVGGSIFQQRKNMHRIQDFRIDVARKHKTYRFPGFLGSTSQVLTVDPVNVEYMLKTNFANYGKRWSNDIILIDLLGEGIFNVDGEKWHHQRKLTSYEFSSKTMRDFSNVVSKTNAIKLAQILADQAAASNRSIDIQDLFEKATLDSTFKVIVGVELDVMCGTFEEGIRFSDSSDAARSLIAHRPVDVFWKIKRYLNIGSEALLRKCIKEVDEFVYKTLKSKIEEQLQNSSHGDHGIQMKKSEDVLSRFLEAKQTDTKHLRDMIINLVMAGKDTTSAALFFVFYMMCKHPDIQEKIAKEVIEATQVNQNSRFDELAANVNENTLDKMQYLHAALTETLRLYPSVPARWSNDITLIDLLGEGIFNVDGEKWHHQRKLTSYEFSTKTLRDFSNKVSKTNAIKLARILADQAVASNRSIDIQDLFEKATLDSAFKIIVGVELDVMCGTFEEGIRFSDSLDAARSLTAHRLVDVFWKIKRYLNIGSEALLRKCIKEVDEFVYKIIKSKIEEQVQNSSHDDHDIQMKKSEDVLSRFLEVKQTDTKYLRDMIINLVMAGKDTTSAALSFFFYMMCKHPDIQEKIAKEVIEATQVNQNSSFDELAANINENTLDRMQYLHAALTETFRLYPPLPAML